jgi:type II secretory pathway pseudopilin PulG
MNQKIKKLAAFTLIELLVYMAILAGVTVMVADSFLILNKGRGGVEAKSELNSNLRFVMERIKRDVASASALTMPDTTAATSSLLNITLGANAIKYAINNNRVTRQVDEQALEYISSDKIKITSLYFGRVENNNAVLNKKRINVEINITGAYNSTSPDWQYSQSEKTSVDIQQDF